jgi:ABC-type transport system involved in cytochrome bd biosynthesis fused ATPase/permease subunit
MVVMIAVMFPIFPPPHIIILISFYIDLKIIIFLIKVFQKLKDNYSDTKYVSNNILQDLTDIIFEKLIIQHS